MMNETYFLRVSPTRLKDVENALLNEGFCGTRFQFWKSGQIFGLVKKLSFKKQMHVRAFVDGTIKAEEEIWRFLLPFHLIIKPTLQSAYTKLSAILKKHKIFYRALAQKNEAS